VDFCAWTHGVEYWRKEFPEWSSMISQFQIFVNEYQIKEMMNDNNFTKEFLKVVQDGLKDIQEGKKNIQDIQEGMKKIQETMVFVDAEIKNIKGGMTTTTSSIQDLQGRVKELERPWYSRSGKKKAGSGSGERMVDLLEDLEKLSCSEKGEKD
jgi:methyl-accepting chemotaxis protein